MIVVPLSLGPALVIAFRSKAVKSPVLWWTVLGFVVGWSPQLYLMLGEGTGWGEAGSGMVAASDAVLHTRILGELPHLPAILEGNWDGALVFRRYAGPNLIWVAPYPTLALLACLGLMLSGGSGVSRPRPKVTALLLTLPIMLLGIVTISPGLSSRFMVIPVILLTLYLVIASSPSRRAGSKAIRGVLIATIVLNLFYTGTNYFYAYASTGGVASTYEQGHQLIESSTTFVSTTQLYTELVDADFDLVFANETIAGPLTVHDWNRNALDLRFWRLSTGPPAEFADDVGEVAIVYHNGPISWNRATEVFDVSGLEQLPVEGATYSLESDFDDHFRVFVWRAEP